MSQSNLGYLARCKPELSSVIHGRKLIDDYVSLNVFMKLTQLTPSRIMFFGLNVTGFARNSVPVLRARPKVWPRSPTQLGIPRLASCSATGMGAPVGGTMADAASVLSW